jgi:hypothetical protein
MAFVRIQFVVLIKIPEQVHLSNNISLCLFMIIARTFQRCKRISSSVYIKQS